MELNGLGEHVRIRLREAYSQDAQLLETTIAKVVKKIFKGSALGRVSGAPGGTSLRDLCTKLKMPGVWGETWAEIWKMKQRGSRPEPSKIVVARWIHAILFDLEGNTDADAEEDDEEEGRDTPVFFLFSPRAVKEDKETKPPIHDVDRDEMDAAACRLQSHFRGHADRKRVKEKCRARDNIAATKVQNNLSRQEIKRSAREGEARA